MNIDGDLRLILCFIYTATHRQRRKISFYTVWAQRVRSIFYTKLKHALRLLPSRAASPWQVSHRIPSVRPTFLLQPKKVGNKSRSPNYVLHPIISDI
jgi:hypothetical protein